MPGEPPEDGEMSEMTLTLRTSTLHLDHGGSPQY